MADTTKQRALTEAQQQQLVKIGGTSYSISGYPPVSSTWKLTPDQICSIIKNITKSYLNDVTDVTLDINHKTGAVYAYVWIPKNSHHVCDNELSGGQSAIHRTMIKYSPQLKEFMEKFCAKDRRRIFNEERNLPVCGIEVLIEAFMKIEFDETGYEYGKQFGEMNKKKTQIILTSNFTKEDSGKFGKLMYIEVKKTLKTAYNSMLPRPKKSYNAK